VTTDEPSRSVRLWKRRIGVPAHYFGVSALKAALGRLADHADVDAGRIGAISFCLGHCQLIAVRSLFSHS
jgi:hypothetical protein